MSPSSTASPSGSSSFSGDVSTKGKEKFIIPSDESDDVWEEGDELSDVSSASSSNVDEIESDEMEVVEEDPFEPVYACPSADSMTIEAVSLDNILPSGSSRRMN
jgi:hypothetical protein